MEKKSRILLSEFIWLILALTLTFLIGYFLFGQSFFLGNIDLHLHDTYFEMPGWLVLTSLFLFITFIIYLIKTRFNHLKSRFSYSVMIISGIILNFSLTIFIRILSQFSIGGWTLYPPLSGLGPDEMHELKPDPLLTFLANFLTVAQLIIFIFTVIIAYRYGARKKTHYN